MLEEAIAKFFDNCDTDYLQSVNDENSYIEEGLE